MYSLEFLGQIKEQISIYKNYPAPVIICDVALNVGWVNSIAKEFKEFASALDEPKALFDELNADNVIEKIKEEGSFYAKGLIPLSAKSVVFIPAYKGGSIVALIGILSEENCPGDAIYQSDYTSPAVDYLLGSLRHYLSKIFVATNNLSFKSDILKFPWVDNYLNDIDMQCYHILRFCDNFTSYTLLQNKEAVLNHTAFDLFEWFEVIILPIKEIAIRIGVEVELILPEKRKGLAVLDEEWFQQMIFNVIHNSLYYTKKNNKVSIKLEVTKEYLKLTIADKGLGISPQVLPHVMKPYYSQPPLGQMPTIGLGLTIAERIAVLHKGKLEISSVENEGTTVKIVIPIAPLPDTISFAQKDRDRFMGNDRYVSPVYTGLTSVLCTPYFQDE